jgi:hypothetical protein
MKMMTVLAAAVLAVAGVQAAEKQAFKAKGFYTETCSCKAPCSCLLTGLNKGCLGVGALDLKGGSYNGVNLAGLKAAYATEPGDWVRLYVQAANDEQRKAGEAFLTAVFSNWGKVEAVKAAKVDIANHDGHITVSVDDGKIMKYVTTVVLGGDKKTPVVHLNFPDLLNSTFKQGLSESCTYKDDNREITLEKGRNAYFNDEMNAKGEI